MSAPSQPNPPPQQPGASAGVVAALVIVPLVVFLSCGGICGGVIAYQFQRSQTAWQTAVAQATGSAPAPMTAPAVNDWWTTRMLAPVYTAAIDAVTTNPQVIERLGEPVEPLEETDELYRRQDDGPPNAGGETILFDVKGPKGQARVSVRATNAAAAGGMGPGRETYRASEITVTFSDDSTVTVPAPKEQAGTEIR